jgi:hypothetical protein
MKRTSSGPDIPALVQELESRGCSFRQRSGGTWILEPVPNLPGWLVDAFVGADGRALGAFLKSRER